MGIVLLININKYKLLNRIKSTANIINLFWAYLSLYIIIASLASKIHHQDSMEKKEGGQNQQDTTKRTATEELCNLCISGPSTPKRTRTFCSFAPLLKFSDESGGEMTASLSPLSLPPPYTCDDGAAAMEEKMDKLKLPISLKARLLFPFSSIASGEKVEGREEKQLGLLQVVVGEAAALKTGKRNFVLAVDVSSSMAGERILCLKKGLKTFFKVCIIFLC